MTKILKTYEVKTLLREKEILNADMIIDEDNGQ